MSDTLRDHVATHADLLNGMPEAGHQVSPDAMIAAAAHVEREYGYGYRIGLASADFSGGGLFCVTASDGARFRLYADRYGNVVRVPDAQAVR